MFANRRENPGRRQSNPTRGAFSNRMLTEDAGIEPTTPAAPKPEEKTAKPKREPETPGEMEMANEGLELMGKPKSGEREYPTN